MHFKVVVAGRDPPLSVELSDDSKPTVGDIKSAIYQRTPLNPHRHQLRLIVNGQLLRNDVPLSLNCRSCSDFSLKRINSLTESVVHCGVSEYPKAEANSSIASKTQQHISGEPSFSMSEIVADQPFVQSQFEESVVNVDLQEGIYEQDAIHKEVEDVAVPEQPCPNPNLQEVVIVSSSRTSNSSNITSLSYILRAPPVEFGEEAGPSLEDQDEMLGGLTDFFSGAMLGCGLGLIMLLLTFDKTIVFSKRFQDGVRIGVGFNFAFGVLLLFSEGEHASLV